MRVLKDYFFCSHIEVERERERAIFLLHFLFPELCTLIEPVMDTTITITTTSKNPTECCMLVKLWKMEK